MVGQQRSIQFHAMLQSAIWGINPQWQKGLRNQGCQLSCLITNENKGIWVHETTNLKSKIVNFHCPCLPLPNCVKIVGNTARNLSKNMG